MSFGARVPICFHCRVNGNLNPNPWPMYTDENLMDWTSKLDTAANYLVQTATGPLPPGPQPQQAIATSDTKKLDVLIKHLERLMKRLRIEDEAPRQ